MPEAGGYLALVRARFLARPFAKLALATLFALLGAAVLAPLLANDRPLYLRAIDRGGYESARRMLGVVARELERAAEARDAESLRRELAALELRVRALVRAAGDAAASRLEPLVARARSLGAAPEGASAWRADVAAAAEALAPREAGSAAGVELASATSFPALAASSPLDGAAIGAWLAAAASLALSGLRRRQPRARRLGAVALAAGAAGALAFALLADPAAPPGATLKAAATRGELAVESALFAPIPFGYAETRLAEAERPPSWWRATAPPADRGAAGSGLTGARPAAVEALFGERALDDPWRHPFGTDSLGRDLASRCLWGARTSLAIGVAAAAAVALVGVAVGALAGHFRGWVDAVLSRVIEVVQCVPSFFLAVLALSLVRIEGAAAALAVAAVIAVFGWTQIARLVRAEFLRSAELDWVLAARAVGVSEARLACVHVLPHALSPAIVAAVFAVAGAILLESALSFLGVGVAEPWPSWGSVLGDAPSAHVWWTVLFPGLFLFATVLAVHRAGEALREALDPRTAD